MRIEIIYNEEVPLYTLTVFSQSTADELLVGRAVAAAFLALVEAERQMKRARQ